MMRRVQECGVPVKTLPGLAQMVDGQADTTQIRDVELDDLLGRTPVTPDPVLMGRSILGRCVLVTGATETAKATSASTMCFVPGSCSGANDKGRARKPEPEFRPGEEVMRGRCRAGGGGVTSRLRLHPGCFATERCRPEALTMARSVLTVGLPRGPRAR
jgi:hypothetical protein